MWGLGVDPYNEQAIDALLTLKQRPWQKGLIIVCSNLTQISQLVALQPDGIQKKLSAWPPSTTYLLKHYGTYPELVTGSSDYIAVRLSCHSTICKLCDAYDQAIVSTSANPATKPPAKSLLDVRRYFGEKVVVASGSVGKALRPSTIINPYTNEILRA